MSRTSKRSCLPPTALQTQRVGGADATYGGGTAPRASFYTHAKRRQLQVLLHDVNTRPHKPNAEHKACLERVVRRIVLEGGKEQRDAINAGTEAPLVDFITREGRRKR